MSTSARLRRLPGDRLRRRVVAGLASRLPADRGPGAWQDLATATRMRRAERLLATDPREALQLIAPLCRGEDRAAPLMLAARAHERLGENDRALDLAGRATRATDRTAQTIRERRQLATRTGVLEEDRAVSLELATTMPASEEELAVTARELRRAPREVLTTFQRTVAAGDPDDPVTAAAAEEALALLAEHDLVEAHEQDRERFTALSHQVLQERRQALGIITRALVRRRAWEEAARFICVTPGSQLLGRGVDTRIPVNDVNGAGHRALQAGHATAAAMLAGRAFGADPASKKAKQTFTAAQDQLRIIRKGWTYPPAAERPVYDPDTRSGLAVLSQSMPHTGGGYATRTHGVLTGLAARGRHVEAVTRLGFPYDRWAPSSRERVPASDEVDGIVYHRLLDSRRRYPQHPLHDYVEETARGVERLATAQRAAVIHASSFYVAGMAGLTAARRLGIPFIYEMRGLEELMKISRDEDFAGSDREAFLKLVEDSVALGADAVLPLTRALADEMISRGVPDENVTVIPNGVHTHLFAPMERDRELEERFGFRDRTVIGYVGGLVDYEGVDLLLQAVARLRAANGRDDFRVLIVGDGAYERVVRETAAAEGVLDLVTFTGRVPHAEVNRYLSLVDIAPFPRLPLPVCELISPIKPFESMAMGKAVIASDVAALAEIVTDHRTGRLFRKGDADSLAQVLAELLDDPAQRAALGAEARAWVQAERDWSTITATVDEVYTEVMTRRGLLR